MTREEMIDQIADHMYNNWNLYRETVITLVEEHLETWTDSQLEVEIKHINEEFNES